MSEKKIALRDVRKPRHGWFDYEIYDVFGDHLGHYGIGVYNTFARFCYGGVRVTMSLRQLERHSRMDKTTFSRALERVMALGLVIRQRGRTSQSASSYELVDVKDLVEEYLRAAAGQISLSEFWAELYAVPQPAKTPLQDSLRDFLAALVSGGEMPKSVSHRDSFEEDGASASQTPPSDMQALKRRAPSGDERTEAQDAAGDIRASASAAEEGDNCLTQRQLHKDVQKDEAAEGKCLTGRTDVSHSSHTCVSLIGHALIKRKKKEEEVLNPPTPLASKGGVLPEIRAGAAAPEEPKTGNGKSNGEDLAGEGQEQKPRRRQKQEQDPERAEAVAKVMRECDLSDPRLEPAIDAAMLREAGRTDERPKWNAIAEAMAEHYRLYCESLPLMRYPVGPRKFFAHGLWKADGRWPWDQKRLERHRNARIGT